MAGYSIPSQKILQANHNNLLQKLLTSFGNSSEYSGLQEFRQAVFFDLFQNNANYFRTHSEVLMSTVSNNIDFRHFNNLQLSDVTEFLQTSLLTFFEDTNMKFQDTLYSFIHHAPSDIVSFYKKELRPLIVSLQDDLGFDLDFDIPIELVLDGPDADTQRTKNLYKNLHNFALSNDIKINDIKIKNEKVLFNLLDLLKQELYNVELGAMMGVVPGTEGTRPAVNFTLALYESLDEIFENQTKFDQQMLARKFEHFAMDIPSHELVLLEDYKGMPKEFLKRKLRTYLTNFVDNANEYMKGQDGFIQNLAYDRDAYFDRGSGIREYSREMFVKELIETELVDIDILIRNSPDPIGLLVSLDDAHQPFQINNSFPPFVGETVVNKLNELFNLNTNGSFNTEKIFRPGYEGMTISELLAETLHYPRRDDFNDITPIINKLEKYNQPIGKDGSLYLTPNPDNPQNVVDDLSSKKLTKTEFKDILKTIEKDVIETFDLQTHSVFITNLENELKARGYDLSDKTLQKQLDNWAMNNSDFMTARGSQGLLYEDLKKIDNEEGVGFIGLAEGLDENMNVIEKPNTPPDGRPLGPGAAYIDELDEAIAATDGVENLNKAKAVIRNNPGVFKKVLNVVEKLDIGDQVIQQVLKKAFPKIGLSALAGPVGITYAAYEMALLLYDVGNSLYQQQTTDESFWENFGEVSDKYSIAYKISKPVYDTLIAAVQADLEDNDTLYLLGR